jgi:hypothetical protein
MIKFTTSEPHQLLAKFDAAIAKGSGPGSITTWQKVEDDYTHVAPGWAKKAYMEPKIEPNGLVFNIIKNVSTNVTVEVYAYYHGHLMETFLRHFDHDYDSVETSALGSAGDLVGIEMSAAA